MSPDKLRDALSRALKPVFYSNGLCADSFVPKEPDILFVGDEVLITDEGLPLEERKSRFAAVIADYFAELIEDQLLNAEFSGSEKWALEFEADVDSEALSKAIFEAVLNWQSNPAQLIVDQFTLTQETLAVIHERMGIESEGCQ